MASGNSRSSVAPREHLPVPRGGGIDDEISLLDLALVLYRRRWVMVVIFLAAVAMAATYAFVRTPAYTYTTVLEIGSYLRSGPGGERVRVPVQPAATVRSRIKRAIIPAVVADQQPEGKDQGLPRVTLDKAASGDDAAAPVFVLHSEAPASESSQVHALQQAVADRLLADHRQRLETIRTRETLSVDRAKAKLAHLRSPTTRRARLQPREQALADAARAIVKRARDYRTERLRREHAIKNAELKQQALNDKHRLLLARRSRLDEREKLTREQLGTARATLKRLSDNRMKAAGETVSSSSAMVMLTIDSQIARMRSRVDDLETRLRVGLPDRRDELANALEENARARTRAANTLADLKRKHEQAAAEYQRQLANLCEAMDKVQTAFLSERQAYQEAIADARRAVRAARNEAATVVPTKSEFVALRSASAVGPGGAVILALGGVLGGMLSLFGAFVAEFVGRARRYLR
ncbi:Wzz/FepE/Etk N-terminal domain-containing protein [Arhodomonas aquaeolei]|uniref:Wzz/FepE/Etk N-terminal domain-containing protein n=1 Tax=Arhodomonas aquaeolei TaxID=2369 RepID=UPI0012EB9CCC|nr:Wzz/FepE/Etk N-terminal domain-containing protein [Arhodomonas aquaeolei]